MQKKSSIYLLKLFATIVAGILLNLTSLQATVAGKTPVSYQKAFDDAVKVAAMKNSWTVMRGAGNSMAPLYGDNSVLVVEKASFTQLSLGMVAVYRDSEGSLVAHTVTAKTDSGWVAQGLNNRGEDPERISKKNFVGVVFGVFNASQDWQQSKTRPTTEQIPVVYGKTF